MSTAAASTTTTTLFLWLFVAVAFNVVNVGFCYGTTRCIPNERKALLEFKKHLKDPSNRLATWAAAADDGDDDAVADCCGWYGVSCHHCDNSTAQYVTGLHLRSLSSFEYQNSFYGGDFDDYKKTLFGGNITSALLSLKHLRYLDLSYNDFGGVRIPSFFGSMGSLRYLDLSEAGFGGMIPHQLGNLSNLQYLDLNNHRYYAYEQYYSYSSYAENLHWLSGLSSLKFLDMGSVNLSKALNWVQEVSTTFPSLLELHLPGCKLPSPQPHLLNIVNASSSSLSILDLSRNKLGQQDSDFDFFFSWVSGFKTLNSLNLEANEFRGSIPRELQNMSSLSELYLGGNRFNSSIPNWLFGHLKVLSLFSNYLSSFQPKSSSSSVDNFSSLSVLDLSNNKFQGPIPNEIKNMTSLQKLDLFGNKFDSGIPNWLYGMARLEHLDLGGNDLEGKISSAIGNLNSLITLRMTQRLGSKLVLEGGIPMSFKNSCNLKELHLSDVSLKQDINQVFEILSLSGPTCVSNNRLELLLLANCQLFGRLTTTNQNLGRLMSLKILDLSGNSLNGTLPVSLGRLKNLQELGLSGNSLDGEVSEAHFESLTSLQVFASSGLNQLKLRVSPDWIPPFRRIKYLLLGSWDIGLQFPTWLRSLESLSYLDLSNSGIATTIPVWFWNISSNLIFLDLSHNQIHGIIPSTLLPLISPYSWINLSSNRFHGPLPLVSSKLALLDLSNNSFSGSISNFLCPDNMHDDPRQMQVLNLGQNLLSGEMPICWAAWPSLVIIDLNNNKLNGTIPESIGTLGSLGSLRLRNNNLSGELPPSLSKCTKLIAIDAGENALVGNISSRINEQALPGMKILNFHSNKLSGPIPKELCHSSSLHILDLANNLFDGTTSCFSNLSAMVKMNESNGLIQAAGITLGTYPTFETALLQIKGNMLEYSTNLEFVRSLDLSNNKLSGEILDEISSLSVLLSLNLPHNALSGGIPKNVGFMKGLNSLDLSVNQLSGEISESISRLTFLDHLNLSHNKLSGRIPSGTQIQSFDASSFAGNELCGRPLPNNCGTVNDDAIPSDANDEDGDEMIWFYVSMAFGFVGGFWGFVCPLLLNRRWRFAYSQFLDRLGNRIRWRLYKFGQF